jgi:noranthrone monooxygenase
VPAVLVATSTSPSLAAKQWAKFYHRGHAVGPAFALLGAGTFSWLALRSHNWLYWGAAALDIAIVPWTLLFMVKTNNGIFEVVDNDKKSTAQDAKGLTLLLNKWSSLNTIRSFFPFAGGILALTAVLT